MADDQYPRGGSPADAFYVLSQVGVNDASIPNGKYLTAGSNISLTITGNLLTINSSASGGGGGAPSPAVAGGTVYWDGTKFTTNANFLEITGPLLPLADTTSVAVGVGALNSQSQATAFNTALGNNAGGGLGTAGWSVSNVAIGYNAMANGAGGNCISIGSYSMKNVFNVSSSVGIGVQALENAVSGSASNIGIGYQTLLGIAGSNNIAIGDRAQFSNVSGGDNVSIGVNSCSATGSDSCVGIGSNALANNNQIRITAVGFGALTNNNGVSNNAFGYTSQGVGSAISGSSNSSFGDFSLGNNRLGSNNCAFGSSALSVGSNINNSVAIGTNALINCTNSDNVGIGNGVGASTLQSGSFNVLIGSGVDVPTASSSGYLNIGSAIYGTGILGQGAVQIGINQPAPNFTLDVQGTCQTAVHYSTAAITTVAASTSGNFLWSMPEQGSGYKKFVLVVSGVTDAGKTFTFPTAFTNTPSVFQGLSLTGVAATTTTTTLTIPAMVSKTGTITVEGF